MKETKTRPMKTVEAKLTEEDPQRAILQVCRNKIIEAIGDIENMDEVGGEDLAFAADHLEGAVHFLRELRDIYRPHYPISKEERLKLLYEEVES